MEEYWLNPNSPKYYKGYRYEKDIDGDERWYDENGKVRKRIDYFGNGNKYLEEYFNEKGDSHNEDGYAVQEWYENGKVFSQIYCLNNEEISEELFNYFQSFTDFSKVTRLEVIDENGRSYVKKK